MLCWGRVGRLILCTDMPILAEGLRAVLGGARGFELVSVCAARSELRSAIALTQPQMILLDFTVELTPRLLDDLDPALFSRRLVLLVYETTRDTADYAISLGVRGILRSTLPAEAMLHCLERVEQGGIWLDKAAAADAMEARRTRLTARESQLIGLLGMGLKNREIAGTLGITEGTVKVYLSRLFQKLGAKDRFELALYGLKKAPPAASAGALPRPPARRAPGSRRLE